MNHEEGYRIGCREGYIEGYKEGVKEVISRAEWEDLCSGVYNTL